VWVGLGVQHSSCQTSRGEETSRSDDNNDCGPDREKWGNVHDSSLSSVGEVVVSGAHVVESSSLVHSDESSIKVSAGGIELHAVLWVSLNGIGVLVVLGIQVSQRKAVGLSEHAHHDSEILGVKERDVRGHPSITGGHGSVKIGHLDNVASVSSVNSFSSISSGVGVTSSPLEVNVVSSSSSEVGGDKVILSGRIGLDDVSSLSSYVEVEDSLEWGDSSWSGSDLEDVRSVLEGSSELRGIQCKGNVHSVLRGVWVLLNWGVVGV